MRCNKTDFLAEINNIFNSKTLEEAINITFCFSSIFLGSNDKDLGELLILEYVKNLSELDIKIKTIILYGEAVLLALPSSKINNYLKKLQNKGSEILICATSAKYYQIERKINLGQIVSMKIILEKKLSATKLINL